MRAVHARPPADRRGRTLTKRDELDGIEALLMSDQPLSPKQLGAIEARLNGIDRDTPAWRRLLPNGLPRVMLE